MQANVYLLFQIDRLVASNVADADVSIMQCEHGERIISHIFRSEELFVSV